MLNKNKLKSILAVGMVVGTLVAGSKFATAGERTIERYNMIIPDHGGNAYSSPIEKADSSDGVNRNDSTGAKKTIYSTICFGNKNITKEVKTTSGSRVILPYKASQNVKGRSHRLMLETGVAEFVDVQAQGTWSPDTDE